MKPRSFPAQRPLVCVAAAYGLGIAAGAAQARTALWLPLAGLLLSLVLCLCSRRHRGFLILAMSLVLFFGGLVHGNITANPDLPPEGAYAVTGRVVGAVEQRETDGRVKLILEEVQLSSQAFGEKAVTNAYLTYYPSRGAETERLPSDGQVIRFYTNLYHPSGQQNPYGFDFRLYLLQRGIPVGLNGAREMTTTAVASTGSGNLWYGLRMALSNKLDGIFGEDSSLPKALLLGDRDALPDESITHFRDTGIAHVLAVSGLHVGILLLFLGTIMKKLGMPPKFQFAMLLLFVLSYGRMLDFAAPVVRASIMGMMLLLGKLHHERADPLTSLSLSFLLVLIFRPLDLLSAGFQLSFAAVLGIILLGDRMESTYLRIAQTHRALLRLRSAFQGVSATLSASLFTAPLVALHFHRLSPVGLLLSPLACFLVGWIMSATVALLPLAYLALPLAQFFAWPVRILCRVFLWLTQQSADWAGRGITAASPTIVVMTSAYLLLILLSRYTRFGRRSKAILGAAALCGCVGFYAMREGPVLRYMQLSAGSADAAVIEDGGLTFVIDAGEHGGDLSSYLLSRGREIDHLILSHLHMDHVGGLAQILDAGIPIGEILIPEGALTTAVEDGGASMLQRAVNLGIPFRVLGKGDMLDGIGASMEVLWPEHGKVYPGMDANHTSLATLWRFGEYSLLTAGDLSGLYEMYSAHPAQILKVAHHGSQYSTSESYLEQVRPQFAILTTTSGYRERANKVMASLAQTGTTVFETHTGGAITIDFAGAVPTVQQHLPEGKP